jgi:A/G-specific adenine glycosylase
MTSEIKDQPLTRLVFCVCPRRLLRFGYNDSQPMAPIQNLTPPEIRAFRKRLLRWFHREQRKLPWRGERDPYRILVSEIMLQQTRAAVVENRYELFLRQFPTVHKLARAKEQTVLAAWSGLGYYRRARALHALAKQVKASGEFPRCASELMQLPGVGRYTAAAVASIAYGETAAVVDGNVKRVLTRICGRELKEQECWRTADRLLAPWQPGDFNQAMMELGAMICLPANPRCECCPVVSFCAAFGATGASTAQKNRSSRRKATMSYVLVRKNGHVLLQQRPHNALLMPGMWELPEYSGAGNRTEPVLRLRHSITTTDYRVLVYANDNGGQGKWVPLKTAGRIALTGLTRKILRVLRNPTY